MTAIRIEPCPSPNHGERTTGPIDILLLHYTGMPDDEQALAWLCHPKSQVSSHYFVHANGRVLQLVPEDRRAWHAGAASWGGESDINSRSIGIEIANAGHPGGLPDFPDAQSRGVDRPLPRHRRRGTPSRRVACSAIRTWRLAGRSIPASASPGDVLRRRASGISSSPAPLTDGPLLRRGDNGPKVEACRRSSRSMAMASMSPGNSISAPRMSWRRSSAISARRALTAKPISRRSRRCSG